MSSKLPTRRNGGLPAQFRGETGRLSRGGKVTKLKLEPLKKSSPVFGKGEIFFLYAKQPIFWGFMLVFFGVYERNLV